MTASCHSMTPVGLCGSGPAVARSASAAGRVLLVVLWVVVILELELAIVGWGRRQPEALARGAVTRLEAGAARHAAGERAVGVWLARPPSVHSPAATRWRR